MKRHAPMQPTPEFLLLPTEIILKICDFLSLKDLAELQRTHTSLDRRLKKVPGNALVWANALNRASDTVRHNALLGHLKAEPSASLVPPTNQLLTLAKNALPELKFQLYRFEQPLYRYEYPELLEIRTDHVAGFAIYAMVALSNGDIVTGSRDNTIKIWDHGTESCRATLEGHEEAVRALSTLPNGNLVSGDGDGNIRVWDTQTQHCIKELSDWPRASVESLMGLSNGFIAVGFGNGTFIIVDPVTGEIVHQLRGHKGWISCLDTTLDGHIVSGSGRPDNTIKIWDPNTGRCIHTIASVDPKWVTLLKCLSNGDIVSAGASGVLKIWDHRTWQCKMTIKAHENYISMLALLPNGNLVSASHDEYIKIWDVQTGQCLDKVHMMLPIESVTYSNGNLFVIPYDSPLYFEAALEPTVFIIPVPGIRLADVSEDSVQPTRNLSLNP